VTCRRDDLLHYLRKPMNYLAHLWITEQAGLPLPGAILGDLVHGRLDGRFAPALERSIRLHRRVDAVTDSHPLVAAQRAGFGPGARRYAGIVLDLVHDHALALDWASHSSEDLRRFARRAAQALAAEHEGFRLAQTSPPPAWRFRRLLLSYGEEGGIDRAIRRVAARLKKPDGLLEAGQHWRETLPRVRKDLPRLLEDLHAAALELAREPG
jgi:acyl carrier protein phosphodiesterase